jgi:hypothetical protein
MLVILNAVKNQRISPLANRLLALTPLRIWPQILLNECL